MPVNIAFAGGNTCGRTRQRVDLEKRSMMTGNSPHQHRCRGSQRMRTGHSQWDLATLSTFHRHLEMIDQSSVLESEEWR